MNNELEFENDNQELEFGSAYTSVNMDYSKAKNKPSINGVELIGNLTTEDLGIEAGSDIELIPELKPESIEEDLKPNQVYNGNAIHDLARLFGETIAGVTGSVDELKEKTIFDVSCTINLTDMEVSNVSNFSEEIIQKRNEGNLVRLNCTFEENPNLKVVCILNVIDNNYVFFYPLIRGDIGYGMYTYLFRLSIGLNSANITAHPIPDNIVNLIKEFDIEGVYTEEDVFNANAILQLMGLFVDEITAIQEGFETLSDNMPKIKYIETKDIYLDEIDPGIYWNRERSNINIYLKKGTNAKQTIKELENRLLYVFHKESDDVPVGTPMVALRIIDDLKIKDAYLVKNASSGLNITHLSNTPIVYTNVEQTISAKKIFTVLPESEVAPTTEYQFTNKSYVDNEILKIAGNLPGGSGANVKYIDTNKIYLDSLDPGVYYSFQTLVTFYGKSTDAYGDGQTLYNPIFVVFNKNTDDLEGETELAGMIIKSGTNIKNYIITRTSSGGMSNKATSSIYVNPMFTSGAQSINGVKTFTTLPETSVTPTKDTQFVNKAYIDAKIAELEAKLQA